MAQLAQETGKSERTIKRLRTIGDLIPSLSVMLDTKVITQKVAYQLAQMDNDGQGSRGDLTCATVAQVAMADWNKYHL